MSKTIGRDEESTLLLPKDRDQKKADPKPKKAEPPTIKKKKKKPAK